jgi:hypothetical protein
MASWGLTFILLGLGSFILNLLNFEFMLLAWVDNWGTGVGTAIRLGIAALGVVMIAVSAMKPADPNAPSDD